MNEFLSWLLDAVQSVDPVLRTVLAGVAILLETSVLIGLVVPGETVVIVLAADGLIVGREDDPSRSSLPRRWARFPRR